jgi:phosphoglycerate-specific signal transduction histidine kinase
MEEKTIMAISPVEVYEKLKDRLGSEETKTLLQYLDDTLKAGLASKEDVSHLKEDIDHVREELKEEINHLREEVKVEIHHLREEVKNGLLVVEERMRREIKESEARLLRWLFGIIIGIAAVLLKDLLLK